MTRYLVLLEDCLGRLHYTEIEAINTLEAGDWAELTYLMTALTVEPIEEDGE